MPEQDLESKQELTHYYKNIFTLKSGVQIEILTKLELSFKHVENEGSWKITGFILNPLIVEKEIQIKQEEIAAIESIKDPCIAQVIPWPEDKQPKNHNNHSIGCCCEECFEKNK